MRTFMLFCIPMLFLLSCGEDAPSIVENKFLEERLEFSKQRFLKQLNGNPKGYLPAYNNMQIIDTQFENLIANMGTTDDLGAIKRQLDICKDAVNSVGWMEEEMRTGLCTELEYLKTNIGQFNSNSLKQRLQLMQLLYWNSFSDLCSRWDFVVDTVGTYPVKRVGTAGEPFSTPIAGIAYYTPSNFRVIIGDELVNGQLVGNVKELTKQHEHMPVYVDSIAAKGYHKIPAQLIAMTLRGEPDTMNFYIEYDIK